MCRNCQNYKTLADNISKIRRNHTIILKFSHWLLNFQSKMGDCQLDDLLDMLNDDEDESTFAEAEAAAQSQSLASQAWVNILPKNQKVALTAI